MSGVPSERLGRVDGAWLRMDRPENTADVVSLLALSEPLPREALERLVEERLLAYPRFRQRAVRGSLLGGGRWVDDERFRLDRHLSVRRLRSRDPRALRDVVGEVATEPLDPARPLWRLHAVELPDGGAIVAKVHHAVADGFALVGVLLALGDEPPLARDARHALPAWKRVAPWLEPEALLASARDPRRAADLAAEGSAIATALVRMAAMRSDPPTPLVRPLSGRRRVAWSGGLPLAAVRAAARARGVTVNDLALAAIAGALRAHLAAEGEEVDGLSLRAVVPVNLRPGLPGAGEPLGNRFGLTFLDLPVGARTAAERVEAVSVAAERVRASPDAIAAFGALAALGALPALEGPATRFFSRKASLVVTSVPGPRAPIHVAGRRVDQAMFWVPHPATLGLGLSVLTYAGELRIGVRADVAVLEEPSQLVDRVEAELAALGVAADQGEAGG